MKKIKRDRLVNDDQIPPVRRIPFTRYVHVRGRKEHEEILKNENKCEELNLDWVYEVCAYLKKWGGWLDEN